MADPGPDFVLTFADRAGRGIIVRTDPARDQYMVWSTVAEGPTWVGDQAALLALARPDERDQVAEQIDRAERTGTSLTHGGAGYDDYGLIYQQRGWLLRRDFAAFADAFAEDRTADADALIVTPHTREDPDA